MIIFHYSMIIPMTYLAWVFDILVVRFYFINSCSFEHRFSSITFKVYPLRASYSYNAYNFQDNGTLPTFYIYYSNLISIVSYDGNKYYLYFSGVVNYVWVYFYILIYYYFSWFHSIFYLYLCLNRQRPSYTNLQLFPYRHYFFPKLVIF